jgi:hypothetical protein
MHTVELLVPESSSCKVEIATEKLKSCILPGSDQVLTEMIQIGCNS